MIFRFRENPIEGFGRYSRPYLSEQIGDGFPHTWRRLHLGNTRALGVRGVLPASPCHLPRLYLLSTPFVVVNPTFAINAP